MAPKKNPQRFLSRTVTMSPRGIFLSRSAGLAPRAVAHKWLSPTDCAGRVGVEGDVVCYLGHATGKQGTLYLKFWLESTGDYLGWAEVEGRVVNNCVHYFVMLPLDGQPDEFREREYGSLSAVLADLAANVVWEQETYGAIPLDSPMLFPPAQVWPEPPAGPVGDGLVAPPAEKPARGPRRAKTGRPKGRAKAQKPAPAPAPTPAPAKAKAAAAVEPWQMNLAQFRRQYPDADPMEHRKAIEAALAAGKVPGPFVLREYPKLAKQAQALRRER